MLDYTSTNWTKRRIPVHFSWYYVSGRLVYHHYVMCCLQQLTVLGVYNWGGAAYKAYIYMQYWITYIVFPKAFHGGSAITQEMIEPNHRNTDKWMAYIFRLLFLKYINSYASKSTRFWYCIFCFGCIIIKYGFVINLHPLNFVQIYFNHYKRIQWKVCMEEGSWHAKDI